MRHPLTITALLCLAAVPAGADGPKIYIFDVLNRLTYRDAYTGMLNGERALPSWMATAAAAKNGTATPGILQDFGNDQLEIFQFCEPHNCGGHHFVVLFAEYGSKAKGVLSIEGQIRFFGRPTAAEKKVLVSNVGD